MNYTRHPKYENKQPRVYKHGVFVGASNSQTLAGSKKLNFERRKRMRVAPARSLFRADSIANTFRIKAGHPVRRALWARQARLNSGHVRN